MNLIIIILIIYILFFEFIHLTQIFAKIEEIILVSLMN